MSTAAPPRSSFIPPLLDESRPWLVVGRNEPNPRWASAEIFRTPSGRASLAKVYALRPYGHALKLHAKCTDGSFKIKEYLAENAYEPFTPEFWPASRLTDAKYCIELKSRKSTFRFSIALKDEHAFRSAGALLVQRMRSAQAACRRPSAGRRAYDNVAS